MGHVSIPAAATLNSHTSAVGKDRSFHLAGSALSLGQGGRAYPNKWLLRSVGLHPHLQRPPRIGDCRNKKDTIQFKPHALQCGKGGPRHTHTAEALCGQDALRPWERGGMTRPVTEMPGAGTSAQRSNTIYRFSCRSNVAKLSDLLSGPRTWGR